MKFSPRSEVYVNSHEIVTKEIISNIIRSTDNKEYFYETESSSIFPITTKMVLTSQFDNPSEKNKEVKNSIKEFCENTCFMKNCDDCDLLISNRLRNDL